MGSNTHSNGASTPALSIDEALATYRWHLPGYQQPLHDFAIYLHSLPRTLRQETEAHLKKTDSGLTWPAVPYTYAEGKNRAYEVWLASLEPDEREAEIAACKGRYAAHYQDKLGLAQAFVRSRSDNTLQALRSERSNDRGRDR